jgi:hypothetical protein
MAAGFRVIASQGGTCDIHDGRGHPRSRLGRAARVEPARLVFGTPSFNEGRDERAIYAFDPKERQKTGHRSREWTAVHPAQIGVIRQMACCLREIGSAGCQDDSGRR